MNGICRISFLSVPSSLLSQQKGNWCICRHDSIAGIISCFLEVVVQQPIFSSLLLSCIPGEGPGSWLMHFPYVVLHGIFGKF